MAIQNRTKSQANTVWLFDFLQKYWILLTAIIVCYPLLKKWYDKFTQDSEEKELENSEKDLKIAMSKPLTKVLEFNKITTDVTLHKIAENVAFNLGTDLATKDAPWYWWTNPTALTEDEAKVISELQKVKYGSTVPKIVELYYVITRRDLNTDLKKYLSTSELKKIPLFT
ncbi:MAG: hypothetical protein ABI576_10245 [Flavobacterium sp.]